MNFSWLNVNDAERKTFSIQVSKAAFFSLKQHVIRKYRDKYYPRIFNFSANRTKMQKYEILMQHKENRKHIQSTRWFFKNYLGAMKSNVNIGSQEF